MKNDAQLKNVQISIWILLLATTKFVSFRNPQFKGETMIKVFASGKQLTQTQEFHSWTDLTSLFEVHKLDQTFVMADHITLLKLLVQ